MSSKGIRVYQCGSGLLPGHNYETVAKIAHKIFREIQRKTKRRPYLRSAYFRGDKIFLDNFWPHLKQKHYQEQLRRLRYLECALEVIKRSRLQPSVEYQSPKEKFYRFFGQSGLFFFAVQIKEDRKKRQKFFMSVFPYGK